MKKSTHCTRLRRLGRYLAPALLATSALLPFQSFGQATNPYNLLPNPSFELQYVDPPATLSGQPNNIGGTNSRYDEVADWISIGAFPSTAYDFYGEPTYYATNAPAGSATNPFTNPATNPGGSPFQPYNYDPALHNGAVSIVAAETGTSSSLNLPQYVATALPLSLTPGTYYARFQAYRSSANNSPLRLGMNLSQGAPQGYASANSMQSFFYVNNSAWTTIAGKIPISTSASSAPWYVTIGNLSNSGSGARARYYIDEVELYKIPEAGPSFSPPCGSPVTIGTGGPIPGATYAWTVEGSSTPFATSLQTTVSPNRPTTYTLTVTLPDTSIPAGYSTYASSTTIGPVLPPSKPQIQRTAWTCTDGFGPVLVAITNYNPDPNSTYAITTTGNISNSPPGITQEYFPDGSLKWAFQLRSTRTNTTGGVTVTVSNNCGTVSTSFSVTVPNCANGAALVSREASQAYPNPVSESLTAPEGVREAVLLNSQGRAVKSADASGKLNVQTLPAGLYNLQMRQNGKLINQRIEVKH